MNPHERVIIFRQLAWEYLTFVSSGGKIESELDGSGLSESDQVALSLRLMLERKFISKKDQVHIPAVTAALREILDERWASEIEVLGEIYRTAYTGEATNFTANFNHVELDFSEVRNIFTYGRLMHADRDKFVVSGALLSIALNMLVSQSLALAGAICHLVDFIDNRVKDGSIRSESDSLRRTFIEVHDSPQSFGFHVKD